MCIRDSADMLGVRLQPPSVGAAGGARAAAGVTIASAAAPPDAAVKLASVSSDLSSTVAVPNSLGPGELLVRYGTEAQQHKYLPGLADGTYIPCFGLTGIHSGPNFR